VWVNRPRLCRRPAAEMFDTEQDVKIPKIA
jgi:hypothetical protein